MLKTFALTMALGAGAGFACSVIMPDIRFDTLDAQTVMVTEKRNFGANIEWVDTLAISRYSQFKAGMQASFGDSALIFLGRFDSLIYWPMLAPAGPPPSPSINMAPHVLDTGYTGYSIAYIRLQIDSVLKGTAPFQNAWLRLESGYATCVVSLSSYLNKPFFNLSNSFATRNDLKVRFSLATTKLPDAHWFDGRYLLSPQFPGLRLDITELYPDYPATSVDRRNVPKVPWRFDGKAYRPDGRTVPDGESRSPVPVLR